MVATHVLGSRGQTVALHLPSSRKSAVTSPPQGIRKEPGFSKISDTMAISDLRQKMSVTLGEGVHEGTQQGLGETGARQKALRWQWIWAG